MSRANSVKKFNTFLFSQPVVADFTEIVKKPKAFSIPHELACFRRERGS
jgi:hypothetical protein